LSNASFNVQKIDPSGSNRNWHFEPIRLQVQMDNPPEHHSQLTGASHGRQLTISEFLTPEERLEVADALHDTLDLRQSTSRGGGPT
jgi:uncharacterized membrane protein